MGRRRPRKNAIELVIENKRRKHAQRSVIRTATRQIKLASMKVET